MQSYVASDLLFPRWVSLSLITVAATAAVALGADEFPQKNGWSHITPSVVWCGDPASSVMIEFHVVGRDDVARVEVTNGFSQDNKIVLYDDATHGDTTASDNIFTASGVHLPCEDYHMWYGDSVRRWLGFVSVTLRDGSQLGNNYGMFVGQVRPSLKGVFPVRTLGNGLSATDYAFFIDDTRHQVIDDYPVASVVCGTQNIEAYRKFYSVFPDDFDVAVVTPGLQLFKPDGFGENVPYCVPVSNDSAHIGRPLQTDAARFGSAGRLKSTIYESFSDIQIFDHEIAHTWGAAIGESLGLLESDRSHFNALSDIGGQLSGYYFAAGQVGHFSYNGDGTWRLISNRTNQAYAPLELYIMGLIPPEQVPPIHILTDPNLDDPQHITAASVRTVTIDDIIAAEGGPRLPSSATAQKEFRVAYIVTQDGPFNDAAYAYFSVLSRQLMTRDGPEEFDMYAPFYWATGGRATLNSRLYPPPPRQRAVRH